MRMLVTVEFVNAGNKTGTHDVLVVNRDAAFTESGDIDLSLDEGKRLFKYIQQEFVNAQAAEIPKRARTCPRCRGRLAVKDVERRLVHALFGRISLGARRWVPCGCDVSPRRAFSPLKGWLSRTSNEPGYQAAKWGSTHSYRQAAAILQHLLNSTG